MTAASLRTPTKTVMPRAIPDALRAIWRDCRDSECEEHISRSLTMNLVVIAPQYRERELRALLDALAARQPCRAFLAVVTAGDGAITASVHGAARVVGSTKDLVLEQIDLQVPRSAIGQLPGLVRPLLVNDIPTHFYWADAWPRDSREFDALANVADHSVVDTARFELPASELDAIEHRRRAGRTLTDLNWLRVRPWRRAMAEVFERTKFVPFAKTTVTVRHGDGGMAAATLLGRWLERRLAATVVLEATAGPMDPIVGIEVVHSEATAAATLKDSRIVVAVEDHASCFLPFSIPSSRGTERDLLAAAIDLA